ncbi:MAG: hypothetical protein RL135_1100 [Bacteroidota bacterium]|jgi:predicted acetyltransferase
MENKLFEIKELLLKKSSAKQKAFRSTKETFALFKSAAKRISDNLHKEVSTIDANVEVKFYEKSEYEMHLKFSGDTLVLMMHTNIFDFEPNHFIHQSEYIKADSMRQYCGMIQIYNFLADSIKYNREGDLGYLVGRVFVNNEKHILVEGKRPLSFLYGNIENSVLEESVVENILIESILYCINFDLIVPPMEAVSYISLEQKNMMSYSSGMPTGKMLGFLNQSDSDPNN